MVEAIDLIKNAIGFFASPAGASLAWILFIVSEALGSIQSIKSNAVYQALASVIRFIYTKLRGKVP